MSQPITITDPGELELLRQYRERKAAGEINRQKQNEPVDINDLKPGASQETIDKARDDIRRLMREMSG